MRSLANQIASAADYGSKLPVVTAEQRTELRAGLAEYDAYLAPAPRHWIAGRIATLQAHYFVPDLPEPLQEAVAQDWVELLADYPAWAIAEAVRRHLAASTRRPVPADIIGVCWEAIKYARENQRHIRGALKAIEAAGEPV